jgi:hypothetical protein
MKTKKMAERNAERISVPAPIVRSIRGVLRGAQIDEEDYWRYLAEKHEILDPQSQKE